MKRLTMLIAGFALVIAACGGEDDAGTADLLTNDGEEPVAALDGTCLVGEPDCNDTPGGEPTDLPASGDSPALASLDVAQAVDSSGPAMVTGYLVKDGDDIRLCEVLAESFPPQCGGASIILSEIDQIDPDELQEEGAVTWTDFPVSVIGDLLDGALVATATE